MNSHCITLKRDCSFSLICKKKGQQTIGQSSIQNRFSQPHIELLQYCLGLRKICKFENIYSIADQEKIGYMVESIFSHMIYDSGVVNTTYTLYFPDNPIVDSYVLLGVNQKEIDIFLGYNDEVDMVLRAVGCGYLLGYPKCCIKHFSKYMYAVGTDSSQLDVMLDDMELSYRNQKCPIVNFGKRLFVHNYCSSDCEETLKIAEKVLSYILKQEGANFTKDFFGT